MRRNEYNIQSFYNQIMKQMPMLYGYQFVLEFVQGGQLGNDYSGYQPFTLFNNSESPDQNFTYYAQSASLPKIGIVKSKASYYGTEFRIPTVIQYEHDYTVKILLEQDMIMYEKLRQWMRMISDLKYNGGGIKSIPSVALRLNLLDSTHQNFTTSYVLEGVWPTNIAEIPLKYAQDDNTPVSCDCKFKYQYCYRDDSFGTSTPNPYDPLSAR